MSAYALSELDVMALEGHDLVALFEATAAASGKPKASFNWVAGEVSRKMNDLGAQFDAARMTAAALAGLIALVENGTISASIGKSVFEKMYETGRSAGEIVSAEGWRRSAMRVRCWQASRP
jgi:aspartyl-tRNA(Asn)/glutamyl-tRNA(Gln) amidotransferase subunit B